MDHIDTLSKQTQTVLTREETTYGLARALRSLLREVASYRNHERGLSEFPDFEARVAREAPIYLQIGGGGHAMDGFFNIDIVPPADLLWDIREGIPVADGAADFVFSEHFLEHIDYPHSAKLYAAETYRILRSGGRAVTGVPDAKKIVDGYVNQDGTTFNEYLRRWYSRRSGLQHFNTYADLVNYVFRDQEDVEEYTPHLWAYDYVKLSSLFVEAGFPEVEPWSFDSLLALPKRRWGSTYVIATK